MNNSWIKVAMTIVLSIILGWISVWIIYALVGYPLSLHPMSYMHCLHTFNPLDMRPDNYGSNVHSNFACSPTFLEILDTFKWVVELIFIIIWYLILKRLLKIK